MYQFKPNKTNSLQPISNGEDDNEMEQLQKMTVADVVKTATITVPVTMTATIGDEIITPVVEAEVIIKSESANEEVEVVEEIIEDVITDNAQVETTMTLKDELKTMVMEFFGMSKSEAQLPESIVTENGETMEETIEEIELVQDELVQDELVLTEDTMAVAIDVSAVTAELEAKNIELQKQIDEMNEKTAQEKLQSAKNELSKVVEAELAFMDGTIEDNSNKLFELKQLLGEDNSELFGFVVDSLKAKSKLTESSLDEEGSNPPSDIQTVEEKVDQLAQAKMEEKNLSYPKAYAEVLEEDSELKTAIYKNIK